MNGKNHVQAQDLYDIQIITGSTLSPDGTSAAYALQRADKKTEKKFSNIHITSTETGKSSQFTQGDEMHASPHYSPSGKEIAFLSNRGDEKSMQIFLIPVDGGEARKLTDLEGSIGSMAWSPDGKYLAITFQKRDEDELLREKNDEKKKLGVVARHITRIFYKEEARGFLPKERTHIWIANAKTGKAQQITSSDNYDSWAPSWSSDSLQLLYLSNRAPDPDLDVDAIDLFTYNIKTNKEARVKTPYGPKDHPVFSPDNTRIAYMGREGKGEWWRNSTLWVVPADGSSGARDLLKKYDLTTESITINDLSGIPAQSPPIWSPDGDSIYVQVSEKGNTHLVKVTSDTKTPQLAYVVQAHGAVGQISFNSSGNQLSYFKIEPHSPGDLWHLDLDSMKTIPLTEVNKGYLKKKTLSNIEEVWIDTASGTKLHGWVMTPPNFNPNKKYPTILEIHGGPMVQYGNVFMHEFYTLAAQGYVVFYSNPRGSSGYGNAHTKAIWNSWGGKDYDDVMAWTDYAEKLPFIDKSRLGVTGGSYGGYMTNWIVGNTHRFKAAVTQRCVSNLITLWGTGDFNYTFEFEFGNRTPMENMANYWKQSPVRLADKVKTPTLVIHSEQDYRCCLEQGEQMFVAMKRHGVDTEMVLFPDESHELSRGGRTDRRIERLRHILRWFDKYLK